MILVHALMLARCHSQDFPLPTGVRTHAVVFVHFHMATHMALFVWFVCVCLLRCAAHALHPYRCVRSVSRPGLKHVCSCFAACGQTVGWVGQFRYVPVAANNTYTGAFRGAEHGLVRFSFGGKPTKDGIIPASAWKCKLCLFRS